MLDGLLAAPCEFLKDREVDGLRRGFLNNLALGQWEQARACIRLLADSTNRDQAESLLINVIVCPASTGCVGSSTIRSYFHLAWLCATELQSLFPKVEAQYHGLVEHIELIVTIFDCDDSPPDEVAKEITDCHAAICSLDSKSKGFPDFDDDDFNRSPQLSKSALEYLRNVLSTNPQMGFVICKALLSETSTKGIIRIPSWLKSVRDAIESIQVDVVQNALKNGDSQTALKVLGDIRLSPDNDISPQLVGLISELSKSCEHQNVGDAEPTFNRNDILSILLSHPPPFMMLRQFVGFELNLNNPEGVQEESNILKTIHDEAFWTSSFMQCCNGRKRVIEQLLQTANSLINDRNFEALKTLLSKHNLGTLTDLILLLAWKDCLDDPNSALQLLELKNSNEQQTESRPWSDAVRQAQYHMRLTKFFEGKMRHQATDISEQTSELLKTLYEDAISSQTQCNVLHALSQLVSFDDVPSDDLFDLLLSNPTVGSATIEKERDVMLLRGFFVMKNLADVFEENSILAGIQPSQSHDHGNPSVDSMKSKLSRCQSLLGSILPIQFRIEIIENMYSMLFLRLEEDADVQFLASSLIVEDVLEVLEVSIDAASSVCNEPKGNNFGDSDSEDNDEESDNIDRMRHVLGARPFPTSISRIALHSRLARIEGYVKEAKWRLHLVGKNSTIGGRPGNSAFTVKAENEGSQIYLFDSSTGPGDPADTTLIQRMLASPNTLLTTCLLARDFVKAQQVIQMFNIENDVSQDALFAQHLADMTEDIRNGTDVQPKIDSLKNTLGALTTVHICIDLAITEARDKISAERCLDIAIAIVEADRSGSVGVHILMPFLLKLKGSIGIVDTSPNELVLEFNRPMDAETIKAILTNEIDRIAAYEALLAAAGEVSVPVPRGRAESLTMRARQAASMKNMKTAAEHAMLSFKTAFSHSGNSDSLNPILSNGSTDWKTQSESNYNYLDAFFLQLDIFEKANQNIHDPEMIEPASLNPLRHLCRSPFDALGELVFAKGIRYDAMIQAAKSLNMDPLEVIVFNACPKLNIPARQLSSAITINSSAHVLNIGDFVCDTIPGPVDLSYMALRELLSMLTQHAFEETYMEFSADIRAAIKQSPEWFKFKEQVSCLVKATFGNLTDVERMCCYANIINMMRLHGCIEKGPPCSVSEWIVWSRSVVYSLGALGDVSLFDLEFSYLRYAQPIPAIFHGALQFFVDKITTTDPRSEFVVHTKESELQFCIWHGWLSSPTPVPLMPSTYQASLQSAKTLHILQFTEVRRGEVRLPRIVEWFTQDFFVDQNNTYIPMSSILQVIAADLPECTTRAYIQNSNPSHVVYGSYSFSPACILHSDTDVRSHSTTTFDVESNLKQEQGYPRFKLDARAADFLEQSSHVVRLIASLASLDVRDHIGVIPSGSPAPPESLTDIIFRKLGVSARDQAFKNLVMYRADRLDGVSDFNKLSSRQLTAFLLDTDPEARRSMCQRVLEELILHGRYNDCIRLIDSGLFETSVASDSKISGLDLLLCGEIASSKQKSTTWRAVSRLEDKLLAASLALKFIVDWDVDVAVDILNQCKAHLGQLAQTSPDAARLRSTVAQQLSRLRVYSEILQHHRHLGSWQDVMRVSIDAPQKVVRRLIDSQHFDLARRWASLHGVAETEIEQNYLLMLLDMEEVLKAHTVLNTMVDSDAIVVCRFLLAKCKHLRGVIFIVRYMIQSLGHKLDQRTRSTLEMTELSATVLQTLPTSIQQSTRHLLSKPHRILEFLLMNKRVEEAKIVISRLGKQHVEKVLSPKLFVSPASKSVKDSQHLVSLEKAKKSPRTARSPKNNSHGSPMMERHGGNLSVKFEHDMISFYAERALVVLDENVTGLVDGFVPITKGSEFDEQLDNKEKQASLEDEDQLLLRKAFRYHQTPSTTLCVAIVDLATDPSRCGDICLHLCSKLSDTLAENPGEYDHFFMINSMRHLLYNAKLKFLDVGAMSKISLCDVFLSNAELLRLLLSSRVESVLSLTDLNKPGTAMLLRDRLIEDDKMELALQVALKCNLDTFDVWSSWGRAMLSLGRYEDAKTKFERCLQATGEKNDPRQSRTLEAIIQILETPACPEIEDIMDMQDQLRSDIGKAEKGRAPSAKGLLFQHAYRQAAFYGPERSNDDAIRSMNVPRVPILPRLHAVTAVYQGRVSLDSPMSSERYHEALFYLQRYGAPEAYCSFCVRHGFVASACGYILKHQVSTKAFVDGIFVPLFHKGRYEELKSLLLSSDPSLTKWTSYLMAICTYLNREHKLKTLYDTQIFMKDFYRAGITSINFSCDPSITVDQKLGYLERGLHHFEAVRGGGTTSTAIQPPNTNDVERYIRSVELQIAAIKFLSEQLLNASDDKKSKGLGSPLSLSVFGSETDKMAVCVELLDSGDDFLAPLSLVTDIVEFFKLSFVSIFEKVAPRVAMRNVPAATDAFLDFISSRMSSEEWDSILRALVDTFYENDQPRAADKVVQRMKSPKAKIDAQIACKKLKAAYLVAVRSKLLTEIEKILELARADNNKSVVSICEKYLDSVKN